MTERESEKGRGEKSREGGGRKKEGVIKDIYMHMHMHMSHHKGHAILPSPEHL